MGMEYLDSVGAEDLFQFVLVQEKGELETQISETHIKKVAGEKRTMRFYKSKTKQQNKTGLVGSRTASSFKNLRDWKGSGNRIPQLAGDGRGGLSEKMETDREPHSCQWELALGDLFQRIMHGKWGGT